MNSIKRTSACRRLEASNTRRIGPRLARYLTAIGVLGFLGSIQAADVRLAWDPNPESEGVIGYTVYYFASGGSVTNSLNAGAATNATVSNLQIGQTYTFYLTASNDAGESDPSESISYTVPGSVAVVNLTWDASANPQVSSYRARYGEINTTGTMVNTGTALGLSISNLVIGTTYFFTAGSYDSSGILLTEYEEATCTITNTSPVSIHLAALPRAPQVTLTSPLHGSSYISPAPVTIAAQASDRDGYITRVDFFSGTNLLFTSSSAPYGASVTTLLPGYHEINALARDNSGLTARSLSSWITVREPLPSAPSGLHFVDVTYETITIAWNDQSTNESGFRVYRSVNGSTMVPHVDVPMASTSFQDTDVTPETTFAYRVVAFNSSGESTGGTVSAQTPPTPPSAPANLTISSLLNKRITLTWTDMSNNESRFVVERSEDGTTFQDIATLAMNTTTYTDQTTVPKLRYYYRVKAENAGGANWSNVAVAQFTGRIL